MNKQRSALVIPLVFALALLAVFVLSTPVFAQDEVPPPDAAPTEVITEAAPTPEVAPTEPPPEIIPTEALVVETAVPEVTPTGVAPADLSSEVAKEPVEDAGGAPTVVTEPADLAPVLDAVADAGLTLVDGSGEPFTLATSDAAEVLVLPDPWFMVGTVKHSYTNIMDAVNAVAGGLIPSDGFIHVDAGDLYDQGVTINGSNIYLAKLKGITGPVINPDTLSPDANLLSTHGDMGSYIYV